MMMKSLDTKKPETDDADEFEKASSSAQIVASIDDLLIEILQRLPLKPLVQLKLVSKHWNSVISDPKLCFSGNRPAAGLIFEGPKDDPWKKSKQRRLYITFLDKSISPLSREITPAKDPWYRHCEILHSCNGLLVSVSHRATGLPQKYYICNPTTKQYSTLPQVLEVSNTTIRGMLLAFDPSKSPHYKVVCVLGKGKNSSCLLQVYSSETGSWWKYGERFTANADLDFQDGVYWNGAIHWLNILSEPRESIYFNLDDCDQKPKVFPMPPFVDGCSERSSYYFGESGNHLHFICAFAVVVGGRRMLRPEAEFINVYEMKRDYSEWFVKYKVEVSDIFSDFSRCTVVRGKNDDEDSFLVKVNWKTFTRYNLDQKTCETFTDDCEPSDKGCLMVLPIKHPFQYIESLCSV